MDDVPRLIFIGFGNPTFVVRMEGVAALTKISLIPQTIERKECPPRKI